MKKNIIKFLSCPLCYSDFTVVIHKETKERVLEGELYCKKCKKKFDITNEIPCFTFRRKQKIEAVFRERGGVEKTTLKDKVLSEMWPKEWKQLFSKQEFSALQEEIDWMLAVIKKDKITIHLDFATGTGMFLRKSVFRTKGEIVALDFGYSTCQELQYFLKKIKKYSRVSIICADARKMPFRNETFDNVSTWHGLDELKMKDAIKEARRVLKRGGYFAASGTHYQEGSKSFLRAKKQGIGFLTKEMAAQTLKDANFHKIEHKVFYKGRWNEKGDYLPIFNDFYVVYGVRGR